VVLLRLEVDVVAGTDYFDRAALALAEIERPAPSNHGLERLESATIELDE
jgi:hypothetical protein